VGNKLLISSSFSGSNIINITANFTGVAGISIQGVSGTYSSNPAADAIQITGVTHVLIYDVYFQAVNGWNIQSTSNSTANYNVHFTECRGYQCKQGFHVLGASASGFAGVHVLTNCYATQTESGDCYLFEDCQDIQATNLFGETAAGSGNSIHIKGACTACYFGNVDLGPYPGPASGACVLIESSSNGSPNDIGFSNGIIEGGTAGIAISAGTNMSFQGLQIYNNGTYGVNITGGDSLLFNTCFFSGNGVSGSSGRYDAQIAGNHTFFTNCYFTTPQGTTASHVNNAVNAISGITQFVRCYFYGSGFNSGNIFNNFPNLIRDCPGYNPLGLQTAPTITASPCTVGTFAQDYTIYIHGGTWSALSIGGNATGLSSSPATIRLPAGLNLTLTYSVSPTWIWIGD
jgi:hypothetical protein